MKRRTKSRERLMVKERYWVSSGFRFNRLWFRSSVSSSVSSLVFSSRFGMEDID